MSRDDVVVAEKIYTEGRDLAGYMSWILFAHNDVEKFPTLTSYLNNLETSWVGGVDKLRRDLQSASEHVQGMVKAPWALKEMLRLQEKQLEILSAIRPILVDLRNTNTYRRENGMAEIPDRPSSLIVNAPQFHNQGNSGVQTPSVSAQSVLSDPEKASLPQLIKYVPLKAWLIFAGLLVSAFISGYKAGEIGLWKVVFGSSQSGGDSVDQKAVPSAGKKSP
jgi:hypothetical protein